MVLFTDAQTYFEQSKLLLQARPSTTKISTKYTLPKPTAAHAKSAARRAAKAAASAAEPSEATTSAPTPKALLTLRTYDPVSGTVLKYQTDKQAEVGRLIAGLGRCARTMAALPEEAEAEKDAGQGPVEAAVEKVVGAVVSVEGTPRAGTPVQGGQQQQQGKAGGGGGKKKGKKGKK